MKQALLFSISIVLLYTSVGCSKPITPQYLGYENFRLEKLGFTNNVLATDIKIYNPNHYDLKLKSASVDVFLNDRFLGHSSIDSLITLPAKDTSSIPLQMNASAKDIITSTAQLLLNPDAKIKINGSAKAGRGRFFVTVPINYEGVQRIQLLGNN